jgi:predicted XRE-type DNA-binding protein
LGLTKYKIKAKMDEGKITQASIAAQTGVTQAYVSMVISKKTHNFNAQQIIKVQQAIADALNLPYEAVWGDPPLRKAA